MRVGEKAAESVVVKRPAERQAERRDEESRERGTNRARGKRREAVESKGRCNCGSYPLRRGNRDEWILIWETGLTVESKQWRKGARCNVMSMSEVEA
jgi:hypothetical protein